MRKAIVVGILTLSLNISANEKIDWPKLFKAVALKESSSNPKAWNKKENALGIFQIRPICLKDLRRKYAVKLQLVHFLRVDFSQWAFVAYGKMWGATTAEEYCRVWNGGPRGSTKESTKNYWRDISTNYYK